MSETGESLNYAILSLKWSRKGQPLTWWRPNNRGYCWCVDWIGMYSDAQVDANLGYYHNGDSTLAVPWDVVERYVRDATPDEERRFEAPRLVPREALPKIRRAVRRRARWQIHKPEIRR